MRLAIYFLIVIIPSLIIAQSDPHSAVVNSKSIPYYYCLFGCVIQEVIYWFELRKNIAQGEIPPTLNSKGYWIITILSIFMFSIGSYLYFKSTDQEGINFMTVAVFSAGFPRLFKAAVSSVKMPEDESDPEDEKEEPPKALNNNMSRAFGLKDYFMMD